MEDGRANFGTPETLWLMPGCSSGVSVTDAQLTERALAKPSKRIAIQISLSQLQAILYEAFLTVTPFLHTNRAIAITANPIH